MLNIIEKLNLTLSFFLCSFFIGISIFHADSETSLIGVFFFNGFFIFAWFFYFCLIPALVKLWNMFIDNSVFVRRIVGFRFKEHFVKLIGLCIFMMFQLSLLGVFLISGLTEL